jgi:hypothetical protein
MDLALLIDTLQHKLNVLVHHGNELWASDAVVYSESILVPNLGEDSVVYVNREFVGVLW